MIITHNNRNRGLFQKVNIIHYSQNETELKASATRKEVLLWFAYTLSTSQNFWKISSLLCDWSNRETGWPKLFYRSDEMVHINGRDDSMAYNL